MAYFITLEGGEGAGKSTQALLLGQRLRQHGKEVILTREPGGSPGAEVIRNLLVTGSGDRWNPISEVLLMYAARAEHWHKLIRLALEQGYWVICDRFADSSVAYQGYGRGVDLNFLKTLYQHAIGDRLPDRTYVFDLPPDIGLSRANQRIEGNSTPHKENRFETLDITFHQRVYQGFLEIAQQNPKRCKLISALQTPEEIHEEIWQDLVTLAVV